MSPGSPSLSPPLQGEPRGPSLPHWAPRTPSACCCPPDSPPTPQDVKRCLNALAELGTLQVTSQILQKNTDVVATLKKVWHEPEGEGLAGGAQSTEGDHVPGHSPQSARRKPAAGRVRG